MLLDQMGLMLKDKTKGRLSNSYWPITCLPLVGKVMTGIITEEIYIPLEAQSWVHKLQKWHRKNSRGSNDLSQEDIAWGYCYLLYMKERLSMALIDGKKAHDMEPHSWNMECLDTLGILNQNQLLLEENTW